MSKLRVTLACWDYDRTRALADGRVAPEGVDLNFLPLHVEETFFRMLRNSEFDAAEMSLSSYCVSLLRPDSGFLAIPVFPSRFFRHSCIFVSARSAVREPRDLVGKRIGVPEYQMTAPVWIRGILADEYGVDPASVTYFTGGEEQPGREEKLKLELPPQFKVVPIGPKQTLSAMLANGEIDALYTARTPSTFYSRPDDVRRLFPDFVAVEKDYFKRTGIFPIMHLIGVRRTLVEKHPWLPAAVFKAFDQSKRIALEQLSDVSATKVTMPFVEEQLKATRELMGEDFWPYGVEPNRKALEAFLRHHHGQGISPRLVAIEEMFHPATLESFKI
jgi:4,5-dihydroxyphthalate decarboxylase